MVARHVPNRTAYGALFKENKWFQVLGRHDHCPIPHNGDQRFLDSTVTAGLGWKVSGGTSPRLSWDRHAS